MVKAAGTAINDDYGDDDDVGSSGGGGIGCDAGSDDDD